MKSHVSFLSLAFLATALVAAAQTAGSGSSGTYDRSTTATNAAKPSATTDAGKLNWSDRHFVTKAADGGQTEVQLGQLGVERASNPDVRAFAQKLITDHTTANA